ncbi:aspartate-semialdehyde dehydrogenase [Paraphotobacterium marinum]|uniref:Aspartate-semialdehyde dehydrogenase n=1 Tax=Paraphotobacterium marinum TaxID=1755811 RepID=A0A220VBE9_9GAMM|nr:aspartate-semialdehyde dehydrogenase [Paraphotobacterium marinum]ASK77744.1 aspartate-semialdehyde dehydrogenase [Paraphotobacterium marinum]
MTKEYNIAILGATGAVGEMIIEVLEERNFPVQNLFLLASKNSAGKTLQFKGKSIRVENVEEFDWNKAEIAIFSAGGSVSEKWAPIAAMNNVVVIDNTSQFRYDDQVPLIIPEVNPEDMSAYTNKNIIANPNCSTIQMLVALKPIYDLYGIDKINVSTYQSVSGAGKSAINELAGQTANLLNSKELEKNVFSDQIAFNCIPQIDVFMENGYTKEEMKMVWETKKILNDFEISVNATCVRVPVFFGHSESVNIETNYPFDIEQVKDLMRDSQYIKFFEDDEFPTQVTHGANQDLVMVGRLRKDLDNENGLNLWVVADNIRKGAATNSVQIAELLINQYL